jgi:N,N'-diacetyllegionaminate synthase
MSDEHIIKIGKREIGGGRPVFIIAEAGVNHNGELKLAKALIDQAVNAGADAIKFQTFFADNLLRKDAGKPVYQELNTSQNESQYEMLKRLELNEEQHSQLMEYAYKKDIIFFSTPYDNKSADMLEKLMIPAYKLSSIEIINHPFLEYVAKKGKPLILSTGMSTLEEVDEAVRIIKKTGCLSNLVLLHCQFNYPARFEDINLNSMLTLGKKFNVQIGYSDHTSGIVAPIAATALGARVIEKHLTLDCNMKGPDHKASMELKEFKEMVNAIRNTEKLMGSFEKKPHGAEIANIKISRKSIAAKQRIIKGMIITKDMLCSLRPGSGFFPTYNNINKIVGKAAKMDINKGDLIKEGMF